MAWASPGRAAVLFNVAWRLDWILNFLDPGPIPHEAGEGHSEEIGVRTLSVDLSACVIQAQCNSTVTGIHDS